MDDAFRMVAARMPRARRLTPFAARATVLLVVLGMLLVVFASFIASEQRAADARRAQLEATQRADAEAQARATAAQVGAADPGTPDGAAVRGLVNEHAQQAATTALGTARRFATTASIDGATAAAISPLDPSLLFVDGPSTGPSVVSVLRRRRRMGGGGRRRARHLLLGCGRARRSHAIRRRHAVHRDGRARGRPGRLVARRRGPHAGTTLGSLVQPSDARSVH